MIKSRFPPLNLDSFDFMLKVVEAWSRMLKYSSEQRVRHCGELCRCLKMWQVLSLTKCSRRRVDKYWEVDETPRHLFTRVCVSTWSVITRRRNLDIYPHAYVSTWSVIACRRNLDIYPHAYVSAWSVMACRWITRHLSTRVRKHLVSDRTSHVFRHLHNSPQCRTLCQELSKHVF